MAMIETWVNQDLTAPVQVVYLPGNVFSQDNNGNLIGVNVFQGGEPATLSGSVSASVIRADGATVAVTGSLSGNQCSVVLPQACYAVPGVLSIVIKLTSGETVTAVGAVVANVYRSSTDTVVDPGTIIPDIATLVEEIEAAVASIPADYSSLWTSLAPAFSTSTAYAVGQYVTYNGGLYRFISAHAAGTWNSAHVVAVNLGNDISALRSDIDETADDIDELSENTINKWINPLYNANGITITQNKDGSAHIQGTPAEEALFIDHYFDTALPSGSYALSCRKTGLLTGAERFFVTVRNQQNTGTQFIQMTEGVEYGALTLSAFAPYRCELVLFSDTTYNCDVYVQLESGTEATDYLPPKTAIDYEARSSIEELESAISERNSLLGNFKNYVDIIKITEKSALTKYGLGAGVLEHLGTSVHYSLATASNGGFYTEYFTTDEFVLQVTRLAFDLSIVSGSVRVWLNGTMKDGTDYTNVIAYPTAGHNEVDIDFAYYDVYTTLDISKPIRFLFTNGGSEISDYTVGNMIFKSLVTSQGYAEQYEDGKVYQMLDNLAGMIPEIPDETYIKSPDGNKWRLTVSNNGALSAQRVTPHKSAFIGNSLLMGWSTFGMSASDNEHDYYYHVTSRIHELDNSATYTHLSNGNLEHSTNANDFNTAFNIIKPYLTADLDLICIQLGDNVNTSAKVAQFEADGGSFETMVEWIRANCPNTRLIWVGTWYPSIHDWLVSACASNGVEFVDILPLSTTENKAVLGDIVHRTEDRTQTLTGTYTVSGGELSASVTIYGKVYNITIPSYTSVEDNGNGTFTMIAPYTVIDSTGVQSHPGDAGMLAIAEKVLRQIGID